MVVIIKNVAGTAIGKNTSQVQEGKFSLLRLAKYFNVFFPMAVPATFLYYYDHIVALFISIFFMRVFYNNKLKYIMSSF